MHIKVWIAQTIKKNINNQFLIHIKKIISYKISDIYDIIFILSVYIYLVSGLRVF